ncbi:MAG TPA: hypothetical protein VFZ59_14520 [Verrucomicrobiae bacterium]|nr:hypothetical protein [Verrucomicrobiae bacterium]
MRSRSAKIAILIGLAVVASSPAFACATCYGASDSPLAQGMNWGIMVLLGFVGMVMTGIVAFFVHVGRNSGKVSVPGTISNNPDKLT